MKQTTEKKPTYLYVSPRLLCIMLAVAFLLGVGLTLLIMPSGGSAEAEETAPPVTTESTEASTEPEESEPPKPVSGLDLSDPLLVLINREHPFSAATRPELTELTNGLYVDYRCYGALIAMLNAGEQEGLEFVVCSAYRSYEEQEMIYNRKLQEQLDLGKSQEEAQQEVLKYTMPAGCSEHSSGLAVDIVAMANQRLDETQKDTPEQQWLQTHCAQYGFILRYPTEKSDITGVAYESWHYRYVGVQAAQFLTEHQLTLEEFWSIYG